MITTFSGISQEIYEISNVDQLVGLRSEKDRDFRIAVRHININSAIYTSVVIYNERINTDIVSMLVSCENDILGVNDAVITQDDLITILSSFGFSVRFVNMLELTPDTVNFLRSLYDVGYRYFNFSNQGMFVYMFQNDVKSKADAFTNYDKCDFSKFFLSENEKSVYTIGDYI